MIYLLAVALLCVGVYCVLAKRNLIKIIIGIAIIEYAVNYSSSSSAIDGRGALPFWLATN